MVPFSFCGQEWQILPSRAVYWPAERTLLVADLHLEKASFYAGTGQFLPPYDSRETLERVAQAIGETGARRVITLGDNFHDDGGAARLEPHAAGMLDALTRAVDWVWITGNHDPALAQGSSRKLGGHVAEELEVRGIVLRHQARAGETRPELSGHYHPKLQLRIHHRRISRPCAVVATTSDASQRLILPAFGALTGGMNAGDPAIVRALQPAARIDAVVPAAGKLATFALWRAAA